jgi:hypothetical protein
MINKIRVINVVEKEGEKFALVELQLTVGSIQTSIPAEQLIKAGQNCVNHEQDQGIDMVKLAENLVFGGQNE